jgi:hypothetical protein
MTLNEADRAELRTKYRNIITRGPTGIGYPHFKKFREMGLCTLTGELTESGVILARTFIEMDLEQLWANCDYA